MLRLLEKIDIVWQWLLSLPTAHRRTRCFVRLLHASRTLVLEEVNCETYDLSPATLVATTCGLSYAMLPLTESAMVVRSIACVEGLMFVREALKLVLQDPMKNRNILFARWLIIQDGLEHLHPLMLLRLVVIIRRGLNDWLLLPETCRMTEPVRGVLR